MNGGYGFSDEKKTIVEQLLQDVYKYIESLEHNLKGEDMVFNDKENKYTWTQRSAPLMNQAGLRVILTPVRTIVNPNTICSGFDDEDIRIWTIWTSKMTTSNIAKNYKQFGIAKTNFDIIVHMVESSTKSALYRARKGITLDVIRDMNQIRELQNYTQVPMQQQNPGILSRLKLNPFGLFNRGGQ
jgi:hypothetical protein